MATYGLGIIDNSGAPPDTQTYVRRVRPLAAHEVVNLKAQRRSAGQIMVIVFPDQDAVDAWYANPD